MRTCYHLPCDDLSHLEDFNYDFMESISQALVETIVDLVAPSGRGMACSKTQLVEEEELTDNLITADERQDQEEGGEIPIETNEVETDGPVKGGEGLFATPGLVHNE